MSLFPPPLGMSDYSYRLCMSMGTHTGVWAKEKITREYMFDYCLARNICCFFSICILTSESKYLGWELNR